MQTGNTDFIYKNHLDKSLFSTWGGLWWIKKLTRRTESGKGLGGKDFEIASTPKYDGYQRGLPSMVYKFFDKKSSGSGVATLANKSMPNF